MSAFVAPDAERRKKLTVRRKRQVKIARRALEECEKELSRIKHAKIVPTGCASPSSSSVVVDVRPRQSLRQAQHTTSETVKHEAQILNRVAQLKQEGLWSGGSGANKPKVPEPSVQKVHWDFVLEEMQWLSSVFQVRN